MIRDLKLIWSDLSTVISPPWTRRQPCFANGQFRRDIMDSAVLCHHAQFDGLILEHVYGLRPKFWFDTLSMARLVLPRLRSHSLESLAEHFLLGSKTVPYNAFRGVETVSGDFV